MILEFFYKNISWKLCIMLHMVISQTFSVHCYRECKEKWKVNKDQFLYFLWADSKKKLNIKNIHWSVKVKVFD